MKNKKTYLSFVIAITSLLLAAPISSGPAFSQAPTDVNVNPEVGKDIFRHHTKLVGQGRVQFPGLRKRPLCRQRVRDSA